MSFLTSRQGLAFALGAICLVLAGVVYYELRVAPGDPPVAATAAATPNPGPRALPSQPPSKTLPPLATLSEVSQRPLFSPTRQPPPPQATPDSAGNVEGFFLTSVQVVGKDRAALIQHGRPAVVTRVAEGQVIEGWTVQTIEPERVVLQRAGNEAELKLKDRPPASRGPIMTDPVPRQPQPQPGRRG